MFRPMIYAPMPSPRRLAKSLSGPVVPPVLPFISRNARVPMYQPWSSSPPTPSGSFSPWRGPAPYPSSEIAKLWTRSLDMESSAGFICVEWAVPKSTGEGCRGAPTAPPPYLTSRRCVAKGGTEGGTAGFECNGPHAGPLFYVPLSQIDRGGLNGDDGRRVG